MVFWKLKWWDLFAIFFPWRYLTELGYCCSRVIFKVCPEITLDFSQAIIGQTLSIVWPICFIIPEIKTDNALVVGFMSIAIAVKETRSKSGKRGQLYVWLGSKNESTNQIWVRIIKRPRKRTFLFDEFLCDRDRPEFSRSDLWIRLLIPIEISMRYQLMKITRE